MAVLSITVMTATFSSGARAISVSPTVMELESGGKNNHATLRVTNNSAKMVPIEFETFRLDVKEDGQGLRTKVSGSFTVFPPQAALAPGKSQTFRVIWTGDGNLKTSENYMLAIKELPIAMTKAQSGVNLVQTFDVLVNVSPMNAAHSLIILGTTTTATGRAQRESGGDLTASLPSGRKPVLMVENKGNRHALLVNGTLEISSGSWKKTFTGDQINDAIGGLGLVQAGKRRSFVIRAPLPSSAESYSARIVMDPKR